MPNLTSIKSFVLVFCIALGFIAQAKGTKAQELKTLIVAGGCFWCVEADFEKVDGVVEVVSGYTGGTIENPTYKQVTRGNSGHREAVAITYKPQVISNRQLLDLFFRSIDPTDAGGQFCDRGESYSTAIYVGDAAERQVAEAAKASAEAALGQSVVTPVLPAKTFYEAEPYHQDYYKSSKLVVTRAGPKSKKNAYKFYRKACGRDERVKALWGADAPFVGS